MDDRHHIEMTIQFLSADTGSGFHPAAVYVSATELVKAKGAREGEGGQTGHPSTAAAAGRGLLLSLNGSGRGAPHFRWRGVKTEDHPTRTNPAITAPALSLVLSGPCLVAQRPSCRTGPIPVFYFSVRVLYSYKD